VTSKTSAPPISVLVTGSSLGFGHLTARTLASQGHRVYATMREINGRNAAKAKELTHWAASSGCELEVIEMDVGDNASVNRAVASILGSNRQIDAVVNNAGISASGPLEAFSERQVELIYNVNCLGQLRVARAVLPHMRERRTGLLIHLSSTLGRVLPYMGGLYPATKWAVEGMAESLHYELEPFGIDVVILEPGAFPTTAVARGITPENEAVAADYANAVPLLEETLIPAPPPDYRLPDLQEVADEVARLVSLPRGDRPLRCVVGPIFTEGVAAYNARYEAARDALRAALARPDQAITWVGG
jgi:NAD(P)-dependent dehydrogenase (short-subunit alcohol dehydrogenase family)